MSCEVFIEPARDGNDTCYCIFPGGQKKYLYSKYEPQKKVEVDVSRINSEVLLILGLGLGYEVEKICQSLGDKLRKVYIVEYNPVFVDYWINKGSGLELIKSGKVEVFTGNEIFEKIRDIEKIGDIEKARVWFNKNLFSLAEEYYFKAENLVRTNDRISHDDLSRNRAVIFDHPTFARDVNNVLISLGYETKLLTYTPHMNFLNDLIDFTPDFIFSVNFKKEIGNLAKKLQLKYISWTVDTPSYDLYSTDISDDLFYLFVYDGELVDKLTSLGVENVYYLSAASGTPRFRDIDTNSEENERYSCDLAFVGSTALENEYRSFYLNKVDGETLALLEKIILAQAVEPQVYIIPELLENLSRQGIELTEKAFTQAGLVLEDMNYLSDKERFAYHLAKEASGRTRIRTIQRLDEMFKVKIWGDKGWSSVTDKIINTRYMGKAGHYTELPKLFHTAQINLNITRSYVGQKGLPVRVFDVMASGGFLVSNYTDEIGRLFKPGRDLVCFDDYIQLNDIIHYYLKNEKERLTIAENGRNKLYELHTFEHRVNEILRIVNPGSSGANS